MSSPVILLKKVKNDWVYLIGRECFTVQVSEVRLLDQFVAVASHIRDTHDFYNQHVIMCSSMLSRDIVNGLRNVFPLVTFVSISNSGVMETFEQVMAYATAEKPLRGARQGKTLYVCSDASIPADNSGLSGWAWVSQGSGEPDYSFGVSENRSIVHAELEGILHAIVDNRKKNVKVIHVYCDSKSSVEWARDLLSRKPSPRLTATLNKRTTALVEKARTVMETKVVRVEWVKGHRSHRLNVGADFLSREARQHAARYSRLQTDDPRVQAVIEVVSR